MTLREEVERLEERLRTQATLERPRVEYQGYAKSYLPSERALGLVDAADELARILKATEGDDD